MEYGILKSLNKARINDISLNTTEIIFGRSPKSTVILTDIRCSGLHCSVSAQSPNEFLVKDHSSNGTFINGLPIGKGNSKLAKFQDKLAILPAGKGVDQQSEIAFIFTEPDKRKNIESETQKHSKLNENTVEDQATCTVCLEIMVNPISLYPCLHVFCEECYLDWKTRSSDCPCCRQPVQEYKKCKFMREIIGIIGEKHPEKLKIPEKCKQCEKKIKKFKCQPGQKHIKCSKCSILMPQRDGQQQTCEICNNYFCNLYFGHCATGLAPLNQQFSKELLVPIGSLSNLYEENLLNDQIRAQKLTGLKIIERLKNESHLRFTHDSIICEACFPDAQSEIFDKFLEILTENQPNLKKCPKGRRCLIQKSIIHSQIYSHY